VTIVSARVSGQPVLVGRPAASSLHTLCRDLAELFEHARRAHAVPWALSPADAADGSLRDLALALRARGVPPVSPSALERAWLGARWQAAESWGRVTAWRRSTSAGVWLELYRELRRHIGDERLPYPWRTRLRRIADGCFRRSRTAAGSAPSPVVPSPPAGAETGAELVPDAVERVREVAVAAGMTPGRSVAAIEAGTRPELLHDAVAWLRAQGYCIVPIGEAGTLDAYVVLHARLVVCCSDGVQALAGLADTPCLLVGAVDPVASYPERAGGLVLLKPAVALDTGRAVTLDERLGEPYLAHLDAFAHRANTSAEILDAVRELHDGVTGGATESVAQARVRTKVAERLAAQAGRMPEEAAAFARAGRLARVQAEAVLEARAEARGETP
jgi:hypothetical protein